MVVVSHNHYDHLDIPTLKKLSNKYSPKNSRWSKKWRFIKRRDRKFH